MNIKRISKVCVLYKGIEVGTIALTNDGLMAFEYSDNWISEGFSISPFSLPLEKKVFIAKADPLDGTFGIFADSLPDGWGRLLLDRTLSLQGINPNSIDILTRLSYLQLMT